MLEYFIGMFLLYIAALLSSISVFLGVSHWLSTENRKGAITVDNSGDNQEWFSCPVCGTDLESAPRKTGPGMSLVSSEALWLYRHPHDESERTRQRTARLRGLRDRPYGG